MIFSPHLSSLNFSIFINKSCILSKIFVNGGRDKISLSIQFVIWNDPHLAELVFVTRKVPVSFQNQNL